MPWIRVLSSFFHLPITFPVSRTIRSTIIWPSLCKREIFASLNELPVRDHRAGRLCSADSNRVVLLLGINELPSIQRVSAAPIVDIHPLQAPASQNSNENLGKANGFVLLSTDGHIYRAKFQSTSSEQTYDLDRNVTRCFPQ